MTNSKEEFIGKLQSEMSKPGPPRVSRGPPTVRAQEQSAWNAPPSFSQQIPQQGYIEEDDYDSATGLPGKVAVYISNLYQAMVENDVAGVRYLYFKGWQEVTKSHFQNSEWPSAEQVAPLCDDNEVFLLCYQELCNRHLFMSKTLKASIVHRFESWNTYRNLFDMFLDGATTSKLLLPLEWLNDMIDEFLYQWQEFSTFRHRTRDQAELELLRGNPNAWKVQTVLGYLTSFVERSQISRDAKSNAAAHGNGQYSILQAMGTFSLVGLCRAQVLLADYRYAMRVLDPLDIDDQRALFNLVAPCAVTLFSNLGFAYMMSKRYADAVQMFTRILTTHRTSKENQTSFAEDHTTQRHDKTIALCGLCYALSPGLRLDEQVRRQIQGHEKYERLLNIQSSRASDETLKYFEDVFNVVCPKFVNPATPVALLPKVEGQAPVAAAVPTVKEVGDARQNLRVQMRWFLEDARQQLSLPTIRSYLKLYKSIPMEKLARFNQMEPDQFRQNLIFIKARSSQVVRGISDGSAPIEGTRTTVSDVHFYVVGDKDPANDMVHIVADITNTRQQWVSKFFSSNALKLQGTMGDLQRDQLRDIESPVDDYPDDLSDM